MTEQIIIGITGTLGAGKGAVVDHLVNTRGFTHYSVREFLNEEIARRQLPLNRDTMTEVANALRLEHGPSYIVETLWAEAAARGVNAIIESIRNPGEVTFLRQKKHFYLIAVEADPHVRFKRIVGRGSETDQVSFEKFLADEKREMISTDSARQNISWCMENADFVITNNGTFDDLSEAIENVLSAIQ